MTRAKASTIAHDEAVLFLPALVVRFLTGRYIWEYSRVDRTYLYQTRSSVLEGEEGASNCTENIWLEIRDANVLSKDRAKVMC